MQIDSECVIADFLIVGQGIAGTVLAHTLLQSGSSAMVADDSALSSCSRVAAGIFNPVVFRRITESWQAKEALPHATLFYRDLENELGIELLEMMPLLRILADQNEVALWRKRKKEGNPFLGDIENGARLLTVIGECSGMASVIDSGFVHVKRMLDAFRTSLVKRNLLIAEKVIPDFSGPLPRWKSYAFKRVIFCDGHLAAGNSIFNYIPFKPAKGETLIIKTVHPIANDSEIIHKGLYILPLGDNKYKVGSTFNWENQTDLPTIEGRDELNAGLNKILKIPFKIIDQVAGVRPSISDRRPVAGMDHEIPTAGIFNGMGTKGIMLAPWCARVFADHLKYGTPLPAEIDVNRFRK